MDQVERRKAYEQEIAFYEERVALLTSGLWRETDDVPQRTAERVDDLNALIAKLRAILAHSPK